MTVRRASGENPQPRESSDRWVNPSGSRWFPYHVLNSDTSPNNRRENWSHWIAMRERPVDPQIRETNVAEWARRRYERDRLQFGSYAECAARCAALNGETDQEMAA